ncbi:hypothetical protein P3T76_015571 [Phytophthora citrophthora]|uniref:Uncharacterized protein n=1 Tax=Phytophthora citrophthora TaxID=4793 RepID=A0AAD9LA35_9STRA|nr:hypothetical protein P3T76_015551 [Phytophthora citrophthora]KAK1928931.1 hypothetical protein P3T76_015571 [Phytophthora citrophthora]
MSRKYGNCFPIDWTTPPIVTGTTKADRDILSGAGVLLQRSGPVCTQSDLQETECGGMYKDGE